MSKKLYQIPCTWTVCTTMLVEAESLKEALSYSEDLPLPENPEYIDGSFEINHQMIPHLNENLDPKEIAECYEIIH